MRLRTPPLPRLRHQRKRQHRHGRHYWNSGSGWLPFTYSGILDGNNHTIANLYVNRTGSHLGLFATISGTIENMGIDEATITGSTDNAHADGGILAARSSANVKGVWVSGSIDATYGGTADASVGGLIGQVTGGRVSASYSLASVKYTRTSGGSGRFTGAGGLVGATTGGTIAASYAKGRVEAVGDSGNLASAGGLVGYMNGGSVTASYATGYVNANTGSPNYGGGLVGQIPSGSVAASYSTGQAWEGTNRGSGLVDGSSATITDSYWDTTTSGNTSSNAGGTGQTTTNLQTPITETGIYANWDVDVDGVTGNDDPWDFGTASQYPVIKYNNLSVTEQRAAAPVQVTGVSASRDVNQALVVSWTAVSDASGYKIQWKSGSDDYDVTRQLKVADRTTTSVTIPKSRAPTTAAQTIRVIAYKKGTPDGPASAEVTQGQGADYDADNDNLIEVANLAQLNAIRWDLDGNGQSSNAGYATAFPDPVTGMGCQSTCSGYELRANLDFDTNDSGDANYRRRHLLELRRRLAPPRPVRRQLRRQQRLTTRPATAAPTASPTSSSTAPPPPASTTSASSDA